MLDGVTASLRAERSFLFPGESCPLRMTLDNPKALPLIWLTVRFPLGQGGALAPEHSWETVDVPEGLIQRRYFEKNVSFLMWHQQAAVSVHLQAAHRGLLTFDRLRLLSGDGLCLCVREKEIPLPRPVTLAVFPRLVPVSTRWFRRRSWEAETGSRGFRDDKTVIRNVRAYQPGDNARALNFRLMARGQGAMVNVYEKIAPRRACFLLDGASFSQLPPEALESALENPGLPDGPAGGGGGGGLPSDLTGCRMAGAVRGLPEPAGAVCSAPAAGRRGSLRRSDGGGRSSPGCPVSPARSWSAATSAGWRPAPAPCWPGTTCPCWPGDSRPIPC